ncbi:MAG TPA: response regulator transcription factor [Gallionella sp.]|nr:response regulator transcription factor [Gallionella sp.]
MTQGKAIRLLIADDHSIVRRGLVQLFSLIDDIHVAGEVANGIELLDILRQGISFDILFMDMNLAGFGGLKLVSAIHSLHPSLPILIFTIHSDLIIARQAFQSGASGYAIKGCTIGMLLVAIRTVAAGGRYVDPEMAEYMLLAKVAPKPVTPHQKLSERELHILKLFAQGLSGNEIARKLSISKKTVSTHKNNLMQKMNFQNIADLVLYAARYSLIE